jgi:CRISPR system Cascade subunit CasB
MDDTGNAKRQDRARSFVERVMKRCGSDKGLAARLRRADNPALENQSWEFLIGCEINVKDKTECLPFALIASAIAKAKIEKNGILTLGQALAKCYEDGNKNEGAKARLRRLLAADGLEELCRLLRPVFALILSRVAQPLDYAGILRQVWLFAKDDEGARNVKAGWAQEFYHTRENDDDLPEENDNDEEQLEAELEGA